MSLQVIKAKNSIQMMKLLQRHKSNNWHVVLKFVNGIQEYMILIRIQFQKIFGLEYHFISVMATSSIEFAQFVLNKIMEIIFYPKYCGIKFMWAKFYGLQIFERLN